MVAAMPKLWTDTIGEHREAVRAAVLDATGALVSEVGLTGVTMSAIAERTGIGRATLYKHFPDIESILHAWHEQHVATHVAELSAIAQSEDDALTRLRAVLEAYAHIVNGAARHAPPALVAMLHRGPHAGHAEAHLHTLLRGLVRAAAQTGEVRTDVPADELAHFALAAAGSAAGLSKPAMARLVTMTLAAMRPETTAATRRPARASASRAPRRSPGALRRG